MVYRLMRENRGWYTIRKMAELLGVSWSAYYRRAKYGVSEWRKEADAELVRLIRQIQERHHYRYGSPRMREELLNCYGKRLSLKKTARLMREQGLNARQRRKYIPTTNSNHGLAVCENILNREFRPPGSGRNITYLRTRDDWVYLMVVLDLYDRKVIGWAFSEDMEAV
jgi:transposase InsO family protein